jgi:hypothetical protein
MADGLLSQLLKTPQQIRQEQLDRIRQESLLGVKAQQPISGAMSALPSIYQNVTNQALARQGTDIAQAFRGATQGIGGMLGAVGAPELGRSVSQLSVSPEERQAAQAQQALQGLDQNNADSLEAAARRLQQLNLTGAAQQLSTRAIQLRDRDERAKLARAAEMRAESEEQRRAAGEERATATSELQNRLTELNIQQKERNPNAPDIGAINPQDYTPASIEKFRKTGVFTDLKRVVKPAADERTNDEKNLDRYLKLIAENKLEAARSFGRATGLIPEMSVALQKAYLDSGKAAQESSASALRLTDLINEIDAVKNEFGGGTTTTWEEQYKNVVGDQDAVSALRTRYNAVRAGEAMRNLPPGAASDTDVALALSGVPPENANAETVMGFLRGVAKLEEFTAKYNQAKVKYMDENREIVGFETEFRNAQEAAKTQQRTTAGGVTYEIIAE